MGNTLAESDCACFHSILDTSVATTQLMVDLRADTCRWQRLASKTPIVEARRNAT